MDGSRFDAAIRAFGGGMSRRGAVGLLAALAAGAGREAAEAKRRCRRTSPAGQCCRKDGTCTCLNGGTVCGASCCLAGQACEGGACVAMPEPGGCLGSGEPCKGAGEPCCDGLACGSGQGGGPVACWVAKTGRCDRTAECVYGTECRDGVCAGPLPPPTPTPEPTPDPGPICTVQLGDVCTGDDVCCSGTCDTTLSGSGQQSQRCCVADGQPCTDVLQCCCDPNLYSYGGCSSQGAGSVCYCGAE